MPEGDTVARDAALLRPVLEGATIEAADGNPSVRRWSGRLTGRKMESIRTSGKHLVIDVEGGISIQVWLGMTGRWRVRRRHGAGPPGGGTRLALTTADHVATCVAAPIVKVERTKVIDAGLARLGPDVLVEPFDWKTYRERAGRVPAGVMVADFLLDQRVLAGVGNVYKNEVLFLERHDPRLAMGRLQPAQIDRLAERAIRLMWPNAGRATRRTTATSMVGPTWVYDRAGEPCRRCRTVIEFASIGARHPRPTFWCPACQPLPDGDIDLDRLPWPS